MVIGIILLNLGAKRIITIYWHEDKNSKVSDKGQSLLNRGQSKSHVLVGNVGMRTRKDKSKSLAGLPKNTTGAECEHNMSRMELLSDPDFGELCDAWKDLPKTIKVGIIAMVDTYQKH